MSQPALIIWFKEIDYEEVSLVGQKGVGLGELIDLGLNVPNGFCLTSLAYNHFLKHSGLVPKIRPLLGGLDYRRSQEIASCCRKIKKLILTSSVPEETAQLAMRRYLQLGRFLSEATVAIRSSPLNEKLKTSTFLNIKGEANVIEAIKKCWASLFEPSNLIKRRNLLAEPMAVLIQRMLLPRVTGLIKPQKKTETQIVFSSHLSDQEKRELKKIAQKIRNYYFYPQKIEFAIEGKKIYILKTEPIT